jgi:hypothetical protein
MLSKTLTCGALLACAVLSASAGDTKDGKPALSGSWVLKGGESKIDFADKDVLKIAPHGNGVIVLVCRYTVQKGGVVKAKITEFEGKEEAKQHVQEKLPVGTEFSFTWKVKDDTAKLGDVKGEKVEPFKSHLEGEYGRKK